MVAGDMFNKSGNLQ